jgi:hypothetical protein
MAEANVQQQLAREALALLEPVTAAAVNPWRRRALLEALGWDLGAIAGMDEAEFDGWLDDVADAIGGLVHAIEDPPETLEDLAELLGAVAAAGEAARGLPPSLLELPPDAIPAGVLAGDLGAYLTVGWLERRHPVVLAVLRLLTIVRLQTETVPSTPLPQTGRPIRRGRARAEVRLEQVLELIRDPVGTLRQEYIPNRLLTDADAELAAARLFGRTADLLRALNVEALAGVATDGLPLEGASLDLARTMLTVRVPFGMGSVRGVFGSTFALSSAESGDLGLVVAPRGEASFTHPAGSWGVRVDVAAGGAGFAVGRHGLTLPAGVTGELALGVEAVKISEAGVPAVLVGSTKGTRLELGTLRFALGVHLGGGRDDVELMAEVSSAAVVIAPGDGDGFLAQVLPREGLRAEFELAAGWSQRKGLHVRGAAGLEAELPVHVTLGPLSVPSIFLRLHADEAGIELAVAATASISLGPVRATVERVGLAATLTLPEGGGNLGPVRLEPGFKPPDGAGLVVRAGPVSGGGYLYFDRVNRQYAGVLQLDFKGIALKAVGIITTRMPDGTDGFSLLLIISAEFTPIQLGYGFTLNGVGGLIGVNRTAALDVLRAGIKARTLDSIMFPRDPVANAPQLISNLAAVFPPAAGRFVIGPMARLGWGTPTLVTLDLGLLLELPAPVRLAVLGRLRMALPRPEAAVVVINMDVLGVIDFQRAEASVDATLYDSRIAAFALTGDMAMRASWGDRPGFALSVGGFHPRFQPPAGFPALERLALSLCTGDNPRLRLEAYLALTSNTVQFGARLDLYAAAFGFSVEGMLSFDALFQLDPFSLLIDIAGSIALKQGSRVIMGISVNVTLSGPTPWHAVGRARFQLLFISAEVGFDVRIGEGAPPPLPALVQVEPRVEAALADPRNWTTQLPDAGDSIVTVREIPRAEGELLVHPLGTVAVSQRVAPLGRALERFGTARIDGPKTMQITTLRIGSGMPVTDPILEYFAPADFVDLSDDEKLARPSFERWEAGRRVRAAAVARDTSPPIEASLEPETIIIDEPDGAARRDGAVPAAVAAEALRRGVGTSPAARATVRATGTDRFAGEPLDLAVAR